MLDHSNTSYSDDYFRLDSIHPDSIVVSVIIPIYRAERYIKETLQSVLSQTFKQFEVLIVDDGSPDQSIEICQQFTDSRIRILQQENKGVCAARNLGIRYAKGRYVAFLDADDLWTPDKLEKHIQHLERSPRIGVSFSRSAFIDEHGNPLGIYQMPQLSDITPAMILCRNPVGNGSAPVIRRAAIEGIRFKKHPQDEIFCYFDERFSHFEDVECWLRIELQTSWKAEGIPEALTLYRVNSQGASTNTAKQIQDLEMVLQKTHCYAPDLVAQYGDETRAIQLRKSARWSVRIGDSKTAVQLIHQALKTHWQLLIKDPSRTLSTLGAAYLLYLLPRPLYKWLERLALQAAGSLQKQAIARNHSVLQH